MSEPITDELVILITYDTGAKADSLRWVLEQEGIEAFVQDTNMVLADPLLAPALGGIKVKVRAADAERAMAVLQKHPRFLGQEEPDMVPDGTCLSCGALMGQANVCPKCGWTFGVKEQEEA